MWICTQRLQDGEAEFRCAHQDIDMRRPDTARTCRLSGEAAQKRRSRNGPRLEQIYREQDICRYLRSQGQPGTFANARVMIISQRASKLKPFTQ